MCDNIEGLNIHAIGIPAGEKNKDEAVKTFEEIMAGNFPNLEKDKYIDI